MSILLLYPRFAQLGLFFNQRLIRTSQIRISDQTSAYMASDTAQATIKGGGPPTLPRWEGHATAAGTAEFSSGAALGFPHAAAHFRRSYKDLTLSSLGIGTYLGSADLETDEAVENAVVRSVADGWNVIDTAANYRQGRAERSVGRALQVLHLTSNVRRDQLFISTKAGYDAANRELLGDLVDAGTISAEDVSGAACFHPAFLQASLQRSLDALSLTTVDLFYLHNVAETWLRRLSKPEFMRRLRSAFEFCEAARREGKIRHYGLATWSCVRVPLEQVEAHLALEEVVELAEDVGGKDAHGFAAVQCPMNAHMPEAWEEKFQVVGGESMTLVEAAKQLGVAVFCSGPLKEAGMFTDKALTSALKAVPELAAVQGAGPQMLQLVRSVPGVVSVLVGHKNPAHVEQNVALTHIPPLTAAAFKKVAAAIPRPASSPNK